MNISKESIDRLNLEQAVSLCKQNGIAFDANATLEVMKNIISGESKLVNKVKKYKHLGEYKKCIVHLTKHAQQNTSIFVSINISTFEFNPEKEIKLPIKVIEFLKQATGVEHYFDKNAISDNGNKGMHKTREVKKYIVELIQ